LVQQSLDQWDRVLIKVVSVVSQSERKLEMTKKTDTTAYYNARNNGSVKTKKLLKEAKTLCPDWISLPKLYSHFFSQMKALCSEAEFNTQREYEQIAHFTLKYIKSVDK
jgi:hypothetical protein